MVGSEEPEAQMPAPDVRALVWAKLVATVEPRHNLYAAAAYTDVDLASDRGIGAGVPTYCFIRC